MTELPPDQLAEKRKRKKPGLKPGRRPGSAVGPISGAAAIKLTEKESRALQLRMAGANLQQVADELGYSNPSAAHKVIMSAMKTILPDQTREEYRQLELLRLDRLEMAHWPGALAAGKDSDKHARVVLGCINMRSKILGLEAPAQIDVKVRQGEVVRVELLDMLSEETLKALEPFQDEMARLSEIRAGGIVEGRVTE